MELMLRLLDNDNLSYDDINSIRDDVEYYLQSNQDADFQEDETIYDALRLDEFENKDGGLDVLKQVCVHPSFFWYICSVKQCGKVMGLWKWRQGSEIPQ